jgi:capsular exopolysaccharide synthesis family protein
MSRIDEALRKSRQDPPDPPSEPAEGAADPLMAFVDDPQPQLAREPPRDLPPAANPMPQLLETWPPVGQSVSGKLVIEQNVGPHTVEQFRRLGAVLQDVRANGTKVVMIASAQVGDGKTLTAANLALTLGGSYRQRVLLIDADLRRPSLVPLFGLSHLPGLSEALRTEAEARISVIDLSEHVVLLPGGAPDPDPMASLNSERMRRIIDEARKDFDWIIIDTPPIAVLPDAHLLSRLADASLLVIGAGKTQYSDVMKAIETLGRDRIIGVVLNRVRKNEGLESPYHYGYGERPGIRPLPTPASDSRA